MEKHYIYKFTSPSNKVYIGRTTNLERRLIDHKFQADSDNQRPLYKAIRKYGWEGMKFEILGEVQGIETAIEAEHSYISQFNSLQEGYNCTDNTEVGGDNWRGRRHTPEYEAFIAKMKSISSAKRRVNYIHSEKTKAKQRAAAKGRYSLPWFINKHGHIHGPRLYRERCQRLKQRRLNKDSSGRFV